MHTYIIYTKMCQLWDKWLGSQNQNSVAGSASRICESCRMGPTYHLSTQEVEVRGLWVWGQLGLPSESMPCWATGTKRTKYLDVLVLGQVSVSGRNGKLLWQCKSGCRLQGFIGMWPGSYHDSHILFVISTGCAQGLLGSVLSLSPFTDKKQVEF